MSVSSMLYYVILHRFLLATSVVTASDMTNTIGETQRGLIPEIHADSTKLVEHLIPIAHEREEALNALYEHDISNDGERWPYITIYKKACNIENSVILWNLVRWIYKSKLSPADILSLVIPKENTLLNTAQNILIRGLIRKDTFLDILEENIYCLKTTKATDEYKLLGLHERAAFFESMLEQEHTHLLGLTGRFPFPFIKKT